MTALIATFLFRDIHTSEPVTTGQYPAYQIQPTTVQRSKTKCLALIVFCLFDQVGLLLLSLYPVHCHHTRECFQCVSLNFIDRVPQTKAAES